MHRLLSFLIVAILATVSPLFATPRISAVVNAASYQGGPVAPGSIITIHGSEFTGEYLQAESMPLPTTLGGFSLSLNGTMLPLLFVSLTQVNAQLPFGLADGHYYLVGSNASGDSPQFRITVQSAAPGLFPWFYDGSGEVAALHTDYERVVRDFGTFASTGETILLYGTGLGEVTNPPVAGMPANAEPLSHVVGETKVLFNGVESEVLFAGLAPGFAGLYQINAIIPDGLTGFVEILVVQDGRKSVPRMVSVGGDYRVAHYYLGGFYDGHTDRSTQFVLTRTDNNGEAGPFEFSWEMGSIAEKFLDHGTLTMRFTGEMPRFRATLRFTRSGEEIPMAMETFDGGTEWVGVGGSESFTLLWTKFRFIVRETKPAPMLLTPPIFGVAPNTCEAIEGAEIWGADRQFIGLVSTDRQHRESISNRYGPFGSMFSHVSIFSGANKYGDNYGYMSCYAEDAVAPPVLTIAGNPVAYVTSNKRLFPRVAPHFLANCAKRPGW